MIIKTSGFPEFEIPDEEIMTVPYVTSIAKLKEGSVAAMFMVLSDTPLYVVEKMFESIGGGDGCYFVDLPTRYMVLSVGTEDDASVSMELMGDETTMTLDDLTQIIMMVGMQLGCSVTYANYDVFYATGDDNGNAQATDRLAYIGDTSEPITLSAPSSAFQLVADFVRLHAGDSELVNSTTLLEKIKTITAINHDILISKYVPNEECISLLNGIHENNFYNADTTSVKNSFFADDTNLTSVDLPKVTEIGDDVFYGCSSLIDVNLPKVIIAGTDAFRNCKSMVSLSLPELKETGSGCFFDCTSLQNVNLPNLEDLGMGSTFENCTSLEQLVLPKCNDMGNYTFEGCTKLKVIDFHSDIPTVNQYYFANATALQALILRSTIMSKLYSSNTTGTFNGTPIKEGKGFIYVPRELLSAYKTDSLWSKWASYFRPLEDYTVDGTRMGELDWSKIETATGEQ